MQKKKVARLGGFVGALCATGALVGFSVSGTGAYFTDTHTGTVSASTGDVKVNTSSTSLDFANLLPGQYKTQNINYQAVGTGAEDVWLVFPAGASSEAFTGAPDDGRGGGLGRYGHFAVTSTNGASFSSYNLSNPHITPPKDAQGNPLSQPTCPVDSNGEGGNQTQPAANKNDYTTDVYCAPANAILLAQNLSYGDSGTATLTFGYTPLLTGPQDAPDNPVVNFSIVATQHGVRPDDANNPGN